MDVYVETVLLNNLVVNACLLYATLSVLRLPSRAWRIILADAIGAAFALALPWMRGWWGVLLKFACAAIMTAVTARYRAVKQFVAALGVLFGLTMLLGGVLYGVSEMTGIGQFRLMNSNLLPAILGGSALVLVILSRRCVSLVIRLRRDRRYACAVRLIAGERSVACKGYRDSGNKLYYRDMPVMILDENVAKRLYCPEQLHKIKRKVEVDTVAGSKSLLLVRIDAVVFDGQDPDTTLYDVTAAISDRPLRAYGALLHCDM